MNRTILPTLLLSASLSLPANAYAASAEAIFAGGCFWCMEEAFESIDGVGEVVSGYIGGHLDNPTYYQVSQGQSGHTEAVRISYDPEKVSYAELLDAFWKNIDPTDGAGQFCDRGSQYRSEIFFQNETEQQLAEDSKQAVLEAGTIGDRIATAVTAASEFTAAEAYHQDYYRKNPVRYSFYKYSCGRAKRLEQLWGKKAD